MFYQAHHNVQLLGNVPLTCKGEVMLKNERTICFYHLRHILFFIKETSYADGEKAELWIRDILVRIWRYGPGEPDLWIRITEKMPTKVFFTIFLLITL